MNEHRAPLESSPLADYKAVLLSVIDRRPSGTRQRLAEALGKNRSFISQIVNENYPTPIPAQHLETIFAICHFAPHEREAFLKAYEVAHPGKLGPVRSPRLMRRIVVEMPDLGNSGLNEHADQMIQSMARGIGKLVSSAAKLEADPSEGEP